MIQCPGCGEKFGWWARAVGEYREHMRTCRAAAPGSHHYEFSANCRGCPAGCFTDEEMAEAEKSAYGSANGSAYGTRKTEASAANAMKDERR